MEWLFSVIFIYLKSIETHVLVKITPKICGTRRQGCVFIRALEFDQTRTQKSALFHLWAQGPHETEETLSMVSDRANRKCPEQHDCLKIRGKDSFCKLFHYCTKLTKTEGQTINLFCVTMGVWGFFFTLMYTHRIKLISNTVVNGEREA